MNGILTAVGLVLCIGALAGVLLSASSRIFFVQEDETFLKLREKLPEKISKSGLYHRFEKIGEMVNALREEENESNG